MGVWSLGYAASPTKWARVLGWFSKRWRNSGHGVALPDRALQVLDLMVQHRLGERPIFFICHSLGGLVAKQILRTSSDAVGAPAKQAIFANTRAVLFLATPHAGAALASLVNTFRAVFGATVTIQDLRAHDAHLRDLFNWYRSHTTLAGIRTVTYFEQRSVKGATIVSPTSAHPGVGADPVGLDEDHLSIAKPRERGAQVCNAARHLLLSAVLANRLDSETTDSPLPLASARASSPATSVAVQVSDLQRLLAQFGSNTRTPIVDEGLQTLLASLLDDNSRLRDEVERLKVNESERLELRSKVDAVQQLLSKRDSA